MDIKVALTQEEQWEKALKKLAIGKDPDRVKSLIPILVMMEQCYQAMETESHGLMKSLYADMNRLNLVKPLFEGCLKSINEAAHPAVPSRDDTVSDELNRCLSAQRVAQSMGFSAMERDFLWALAYQSAISTANSSHYQYDIFYSLLGSVNGRGRLSKRLAFEVFRMKFISPMIILETDPHHESSVDIDWIQNLLDNMHAYEKQLTKKEGWLESRLFEELTDHEAKLLAFAVQVLAVMMQWQKNHTQQSEKLMMDVQHFIRNTVLTETLYHRLHKEPAEPLSTEEAPEGMGSADPHKKDEALAESSDLVPTTRPGRRILSTH